MSTPALFRPALLPLRPPLLLLSSVSWRRAVSVRPLLSSASRRRTASICPCSSSASRRHAASEQLRRRPGPGGGGFRLFTRTNQHTETSGHNCYWLYGVNQKRWGREIRARHVEEACSFTRRRGGAAALNPNQIELAPAQIESLALGLNFPIHPFYFPLCIEGMRQTGHASSLQANNAITAASISSDFISFPGPAGSNSPSFATAEEQSAEKELEESFGTNKNKQVMTATC